MKSKKVLIVDDDAVTRAVVSRLMNNHGYQVQVAPNAELGLALAERDRPDLMILDLYMPDKNGFSVLAEFRSELKSWRTRVLMLTSESTFQKVDAAFEIGADAYLTKPFDNEVLEKKVAQLLG
jgi:DNA-binding response OmpR family regulator